MPSSLPHPAIGEETEDIKFMADWNGGQIQVLPTTSRDAPRTSLKWWVINFGTTTYRISFSQQVRLTLRDGQVRRVLAVIPDSEADVVLRPGDEVTVVTSFDRVAEADGAIAEFHLPFPWEHHKWEWHLLPSALA